MHSGDYVTHEAPDAWYMTNANAQKNRQKLNFCAIFPRLFRNLHMQAIRQFFKKLRRHSDPSLT